MFKINANIYLFQIFRAIYYLPANQHSQFRMLWVELGWIGCSDYLIVQKWPICLEIFQWHLFTVIFNVKTITWIFRLIVGCCLFHLSFWSVNFTSQSWCFPWNWISCCLKLLPLSNNQGWCPTSFLTVYIILSIMFFP